MSLTAIQAEEILLRFGEQRVLVVGDLMWDRYIYGAVSRISPEAPVPVVAVSHEQNMPGGASNVAWNVQTLGAQAVVAGLLGRDTAARELKGFFEEKGIACAAALELDEAMTTVKTRIIAESQHVVRVDWDNETSFGPEAMERLEQAVAEEIGRSTGVIIEDYGKGVVEQGLVDTAIRLARERGVPIGYDPKDNRVLSVEGITVATPNRKEAFQAVGVPESTPAADPSQDRPLLDVGARLMAQWQPEQLLITLGPQGMLMVKKDGDVRHVPTRAHEVFDVSGAGDTVIAACVLALAAGASFHEAAELANYASGVVVGHLGTAACTPGQILDRLRERPKDA